MTELIQSLKAAVARYPGTMAELARRAAIDRSTLYKILGGQRTPRREQLERLTDALELTEEEKTTLLVQYKQRGRGTDPKMRAALNQLLEAAFRVEDYTRREGNITNEAARQMSVAGQYVEGTRAVTAAAAALVAEHMLSGDTRPLLLSPFTNPVLDRVLVNRFSAPDGQTASLSQLLIFVEESDISREKAGNIATLTRTLPLLFLPKLNYDARVVRCVMSEPSPGTLMPVYLLLPTAALMMDRLGQKGYIITDREAVENLRLAFSRKYIDAVPVLKLATGTHGFMESVQLYSKLFAETRKCCMVRYQPPFSLFADEKIALRVVRQDAAVQPYLPALLDYLNTWNQQTPDLYFCEEGLLQFVRTGQMFDLPPGSVRTAGRRDAPGAAAAAAPGGGLRQADAAHCGIGPAAADTVDERERFPRARGGVLPGCAGTGQNVLPRISDGGSPDDRGGAELSGGGQNRRPGAQPKIYGGFY